MDYSNTTVVIPTLNEEKNIEKELKLIETLYPGIHVIVADDGSKDKTQEIVKKFNHYGNQKYDFNSRRRRDTSQCASR